MIATLSKYDKKTYAGILARTALFLDDNMDATSGDFVDNEGNIRNTVIDEICEKVSSKGECEDEKNKIIDYIDQELEEITNLDSEKDVLDRLSQSARLPSDLYNIIIIKNIKDFYKNQFSIENENISKTIKNPDSEYHFTKNNELNVPSEISLFMKKFKDRYPYNYFNLLVIGDRHGMDFSVHQVWRIYDDVFNYYEDDSLLEILKRFAENFGVDVKFRGSRSRFFLSEIAKSEKEFSVAVNNSDLTRDKKGQTLVTFSHFTQQINDTDKKISMLIAIDLVKYKSYLERHAFRIK